MNKKRICLLGISILVIISAILVISKIRSSPELQKEKITEMDISIQRNGIIKFKLSEEDSILACEKLNEMEKSFFGFLNGRKGWEIWMKCSNGKEISISGDIITYHGIFNRRYKAETEDMQNFMSWLETLNNAHEETITEQ